MNRAAIIRAVGVVALTALFLRGSVQFAAALKIRLLIPRRLRSLVRKTTPISSLGVNGRPVMESSVQLRIYAVRSPVHPDAVGQCAGVPQCAATSVDVPLPGRFMIRISGIISRKIRASSRKTSRNDSMTA